MTSIVVENQGLTRASCEGPGRVVSRASCAAPSAVQTPSTPSSPVSPTRVPRSARFSGACTPMPVGRPRAVTESHDDVEARASADPFLAPQKQRERRATAGLTCAQTSSFLENCEFVSLGCFCAVAHAVRSLGLETHAYPFDWVRSPLDGVIHLLQNGFSDFLTHSFIRDEGHKGVLFGGTQWGGSFWHHDIRSQKVKDDFQRRINRLEGKKEVPATTPRVFVRAVNTSEELQLVPHLMKSLKGALPEAELRLLVLVDLQRSAEVLRVEALENVLFARVHESIFADGAMHWTIEKHSVLYAEAIATAAHYWAGRNVTTEHTRVVPDLQSLCALVDPFDGGSTKDELFLPKRALPFYPAHRAAVAVPAESREEPSKTYDRELSPIPGGQFAGRRIFDRRSGHRCGEDVSQSAGSVHVPARCVSRVRDAGLSTNTPGISVVCEHMASEPPKMLGSAFVSGSMDLPRVNAQEVWGSHRFGETEMKSPERRRVQRWLPGSVAVPSLASSQWETPLVNRPSAHGRVGQDCRSRAGSQSPVPTGSATVSSELGFHDSRSSPQRWSSAHETHQHTALQGMSHVSPSQLMSGSVQVSAARSTLPIGSAAVQTRCSPHSEFRRALWPTREHTDTSYFCDVTEGYGNVGQAHDGNAVPRSNPKTLPEEAFGSPARQVRALQGPSCTSPGRRPMSIVSPATPVVCSREFSTLSNPMTPSPRTEETCLQRASRMAPCRTPPPGRTSVRTPVGRQTPRVPATQGDETLCTPMLQPRASRTPPCTPPPRIGSVLNLGCSMVVQGPPACRGEEEHSPRLHHRQSTVAPSCTPPPNRAGSAFSPAWPSFGNSHQSEEMGSLLNLAARGGTGTSLPHRCSFLTAAQHPPWSLSQTLVR